MLELITRPEIIAPPWFAARPVNGGPLNLAQPKRGDWDYESKINGWRTWVHVPTGTMFNRHNQRLSIEGQFTTALRILREVFACFPATDGWNQREWADCEGLERRHNLGKGSLIVLDIPNHPLPYTARNDFLQLWFPPLNLDGHACGPNGVRCLRRYRDPSRSGRRCARRTCASAANSTRGLSPSVAIQCTQRNGIRQTLNIRFG
jgi:hypothetical protein